MKTLKGLNTKPEILDDKPTPELLKDIPTYRRLFKMVVGNSVASDKTEQAVDMVQIAMKLRIDEDSIPLEDAQFKLLREKVVENNIKLTALFQGQMLMLMDKCKKECEEAEEQAKKDKK